MAARDATRRFFPPNLENPSHETPHLSSHLDNPDNHIDWLSEGSSFVVVPGSSMCSNPHGDARPRLLRSAVRPDVLPSPNCLSASHDKL